MKSSVHRWIFIIVFSFIFITPTVRAENVIFWADLQADTFINSSQPDEKYGSNTGLMVGKLSSGGTLITRALFGNIDHLSEATINSATLILYRNNGGGSFTLSVQCAARQWGESTLTWNTEGSSTVKTSPKSTHLIPEQGFNTKEFIYIDVTEHVTSWVNGSITNYGFQLSADQPWDLPDGNNSTFSSKEEGDVSHQPILRIDYSPNEQPDPGIIQATLNDQNGNPSLASRTKFIRYSGVVAIIGSNPGTFTNVTPDGYWVEGYQKGPFNEYEFWGSAYADVKANQIIPVVINRNTPYCEDFWFEYKGSRLNPDDSIPPGATITPKALIRNKDTSSRSVYVKIGWRYGTSGSAVGTKQSSTVTVGANSMVTISLPTVTLTANTQGDIYAYINTYGKFTDWALTDSWDWTKIFGVIENPIIKFTPPYDNATISNNFDIIEDVGIVLQNSTSGLSNPKNGEIHQISNLNINYFGAGANTVYDTIKWNFKVDESGKYIVRAKVNYNGQIFAGGMHGIYDCKHMIKLYALINSKSGESILIHNTMDEKITNGITWLSTTAVKSLIGVLNIYYPGGWVSNAMTAKEIYEVYQNFQKIKEFVPTIIKGTEYLSFDAELLANIEYEFNFIMFNATVGGVSAAKLFSLTNIVSSFDEVTLELLSTHENKPVIAVDPEGIVSIGSTNINQAKTKNSAFTVKNIGDSQLVGNAIIESGPFSIVSGGSYNLSPGGESTISIRFNSSSPGTYTNKISFSGGGDAERYVRCHAIDTTPSLTVYPEEEIDFGGVHLGSQKDIESFVVSNDGGGILIGKVTVEKPFEVISDKEYSLTSGEAHIVNIQFNPTSTGPFNKEVSFTGGNGSTRYVKGIGVDPTIVADDAPTSFNLFQNYPNPFNPTTTISYSLPETCHVILKVYNIEGKEVVTLVDNSYSNGIHSIEWDASDFSSGIYFYRLQAGIFEETKKLLLMK